VECNLGKRGWLKGSVSQHWKYVSHLGKEVPYQVKLEGGEFIHALDDTDSSCRRPLRFHVGHRVDCLLGSRGWLRGTVVQQWKHLPTLKRQVPYEVQLDMGELVHPAEDMFCLDATGKRHELRFGIGQRVECYMGERGWMQSIVADQWKFLPVMNKNVPYEISLDNGEVAHIVEDTDAYCRRIAPGLQDQMQHNRQPQKPTEPIQADLKQQHLRFDVGKRVECNMGSRGWKLGIVMQRWHYVDHLNRQVPYQVRLDGGEMIFAMEDTDANCRDAN